MRYVFYPGCSNHASSKDYEISSHKVLSALGVELEEMADWNCCGATASSTMSPLMSLAINARNLALAEKQGSELAITCSSCFSNLKKARDFFSSVPADKTRLGGALKEIGLDLKNRVRVKHILEIIVDDVGLDAVKALIRKPLVGLKVACYYGCLITRPRNDFDQPDFPTAMDRLLEVAGAEPVAFDRKTKCCGASLMMTKKDHALELNREILQEVVSRGADVVAVACPLCQLNLDAYQGDINAKFGTKFQIPILYFTQILGVAMGLDKKELAIGKGFVPPGKVANL